MTSTLIGNTCSVCGSALDGSRAQGRCARCLLSAAFDDDGTGGFPGHEILGEIARGGMGIVYRARQREPEREVALKTLRGLELDSPAAVARFHHEARAMAELEHPAILPVFMVGEQEHAPFFTMKLARGGTLADRLAAYAGKWREIAELMATVADAVHYAHERGVLHRDLKPANILFDEDGHPYVADFGLAKIEDAAATRLTVTAAMMGTPNYMAPEIAARNAGAATTASDVWSLGVMLYELLAQCRPFDEEGVPALLRAIAETEPPRLRLVCKSGRPPRDMEVITMKALAKEPTGRYASAREFAADLRRWLGGEPILARPATLAARLASWARRRPAVAALSALLTVSVAVAIVVLARARSETLGRLRSSLLAQAHAARTGTEPGRREAALEALRSAARLGAGPDVRDEFITALAMPDYSVRERLPAAGGVLPAVSPDFRVVAAMEAGVAVVRDRAGRELCRVPRLDEAVEAMGPFTRDGGLLFISTTTKSRVWNVKSHAWVELAPGRFEMERGTQEVFSPDGRWLARDGENTGPTTVEVISLESPAPPHRWKPPWPKARVTEFSPDSTLLAVRGYGVSEFIVVEPLTGEIRHRLTLPAAARARCGAWRPDGRALAVGTENFKIYLWRLTENPMPPQLLGHTANVLALDWSADGTRLVSTAMGDVTRLWDVATGAVLAEWGWQGRFVMCSADGVEFAAEDNSGAALCISSTATTEFCRVLTVPHPDLDERGTAGSWCVEFSPDGRLLVAGDTQGAYFFDAKTGAPAGHREGDYCWAIAFPDARTFVAGTRKGVFRWPLPGVEGAEQTLLEGDSNSLAALAALAAVTKDKELLIFESGAPVEKFAASRPLDRVALHPAGTWVAAAHKREPGLSVWQRGVAGAAPLTLPTTGAEATMAWTPGGSLLLVGDHAGVRALEHGSFSEKWRLDRQHAFPAEVFVALSADGRIGAAEVEPGVITIFEPASGAILARLAHPHPRKIRHLAISPSGSHVAAMTAGHVVQLWDLARIRAELAAEGLDWK